MPKKTNFDLISQEMIDNIQTSINNRPLQLDFVMSKMTFEHLSNPTEVIDNFTKIGNDNTIFYIEVPSEFPFRVNKFSIKNNIGLLFNSNFSKWRLFKYYLKHRKEAFFPMKEHINFYTSKSLKTLIERYGFKIIDIQENYENSALGKSKVLSALFKRK